MPVRIAVLSGPLSGSEFLLDGDSWTIGRERGSTICLEDLAVSRRHCRIDREGSRYRLIDLGSANGTHVNGVPVQKTLLDHGDEIRAGQSVLLFFGGDAPVKVVRALAESASQPLEATFVLRATNAAEKLPASYLRTLFQIAAALPGTADLAALQGKLLDLVLEVIPAARGVLLLRPDGEQEPLTSFERRREECADTAAEIPRQVVERACREGESVCINGPEGACLAAPIAGLCGVIGAIYFDSPDPAVQFTRDQLELVAAVGSLASGAIEQAQRLEALERENQRLQAEIYVEHDMAGDSPRMREVYGFIAKVAPTPATVLIRGESGTGKELVARAIHRNSPRQRKPFVAINCAALTESLLESELFGHERGAFTGAVAQKKGKFEEAAGGTLFLDEVGELAAGMQAKLLRVLQEREFTRVGGNRSIQADVRLIAATNRNLEDGIKQGTYRPDLYYRLNVLSLRMPALRERREDIPILAAFFLDKFTKALGRGPMAISAPAERALTGYDWPGNVRELENVIERAVVLGSGDRIVPDDLPDAVMDSSPAAPGEEGDFHSAVRIAKRKIVLDAMERAGGSYTEAARLLGLLPNNLHRLMKSLDLKSRSQSS